MSSHPTRRRRIGFHVSASGPLPRAVDRAVERGCGTFQIFCGNPRGWHMKMPPPSECEAFRMAKTGADLRPCVVHACYLISPCASDELIFEKSVRRLALELEAAGALGAPYYVLHPGSQKSRDPAWRLARATELISRAIEEATGTCHLLLENTACMHGPGGSFATLGKLIQAIEQRTQKARIGLCLDSCHAFAAGYDFRKPEEVDRTVSDIADNVGMERLKLLHLNDSRDQPASQRDRHEHIGKGTVGPQGLRNFLLHPELCELPVILETPWVSVEKDRENLEAVFQLLTQGQH